MSKKGLTPENCYLSLQVRGKQENHLYRKKLKEFGLLSLEEKESKYNNFNMH